MNSGATARMRARQRRCCWPPESFWPLVSSRSLTSSQRPALFEAVPDEGVEPAPADAGQPGPEGDVLVDRTRQRDRRGEDHAQLAPQGDDVDVRTVDVAAVDPDRPFAARAADEVVEPVEGAKEGRLAAPGRPDDAQDLVAADIEVESPDLADLPERLAETPDLDGDVVRHEYFLMKRFIR